jgi:hypothetical protein
MPKVIGAKGTVKFVANSPEQEKKEPFAAEPLLMNRMQR